MFDTVRRTLRELRHQTSGNAMMLMALGMPALIGGGGLAVDTAQWYMWKRELQYAVDQAALAGAWARTQQSTENAFEDRAEQEFTVNLAATKGDAAIDRISLANYAGGSENSVIVSASLTRSLPFSSFLTNSGTTITAYAQAAYEEGATFTSCLIAVDEDDDGAVTIGGTSVLTAGCGIAALSDSDQSIIINGTPEIDAGWVLSRGGIDDWFDTHTDDEVHEYLEGLFDPFSKLTPPNPTESQVSRTYTCVKGTKTTRANVGTDTTTVYSYWKGADPINSPSTLVETTDSKNKRPTAHSSTTTYTIVANDTVAGVTTTTTVKWTKTNNASGANATWEKATTTVITSIDGINVTVTPDLANTFPGTYSAGIKVGCQTTFAPGVYILEGDLEINGQYEVTGPGVMFVLRNGAGIKINGGSSVNLTAIQASDLIARGVDEQSANQLAGMLVFEDRNSSGSNQMNKINGNASTILNGTIYLPKSGIEFTGTASVTSQCLMIAAATIKITGTANMTTFCPAGSSIDEVVANEISRVKLVV